MTSLETGKTIIVLVTATGSENLADLSPAAARALGAVDSTIPVRVRSINPTGPDQAALRSGPLAGCLRSAMEMIKLPRFSGAPRAIEYPILIK